MYVALHTQIHVHARRRRIAGFASLVVASPDARTHARIVFRVRLQLVALSPVHSVAPAFSSSCVTIFPALARSLFRSSRRGDRRAVHWI